MDIDPDVGSWVLEYLLRQPLGDWLLTNLVGALPSLKKYPNLQKSLLLMKLDSEVSRRSITEDTLTLLESLAEIELRRRGNAAVSDAMKKAYCAVAVGCTLKQLKQSDADNEAADFRFFETVRRLWRGRIGGMKAAEREGLGSEELWAWGREIETAAWEDNVRKRVMEKLEGVQAEEAVRVYVREERERMGPTFLELMAERVKTDVALRRIMGVEGMIGGLDGEETPTCNVELEETPPCGNDRAAATRTLEETRVDDAVTGNSGSKELEETPTCGNDRAATRILEETRVDGAVTGCSDSEELEETPPTFGDDRAARGNLEEARVDGAVTGSCGSEELEETPPTCRDDRAASGNLEETRVDGAAIGSNARKEKRKGKEIVDEANPKYRKLLSSIEVKKAREALLSSTMELRAVVKDPLPEALRAAEEFGDAIAMPNLMQQRNSAAHTHELDDSEDIACRAVPQSPKRIHTSPLKPYKFNTIKQRRKALKWSLEEEERLRMRVKQFGEGNWNAILLNYRGDFLCRTAVDLKDKWRNMMRYGGHV